MSKPTYFTNFPNHEYAISTDHAGNITSIEVKDFFHLLKVREDIFSKDTLYTTYFIQNGDRPDQVSHKVYDDEAYYWLILHVNDITDYYSQWPLSNYEFEEYMIRKYKTYEIAHEIHHYETIETLDGDGNLKLPAGLVVSKDFSYDVRINESDNDIKKSYPREVTNWEHEFRLNEDKTKISILRKDYLYDVLRDYRNYSKELSVSSSQLSFYDIFSA